MMHLIEELAGNWHWLDERIEGVSTDIKALADQDPACERLLLDLQPRHSIICWRGR